jgi:hypothetical protein
MRFPIQSRLDPKAMAVFIVIVFIGQIAESTSLEFASLTAIYLVLWASAFNVAGGLRYPSGAFIFSNGLFSVVMGFGAKVILGEKAESHLAAPIMTMVVYAVSMMMMLIVAVIVRHLRPAKGFIKGFSTTWELKRASLVCLVCGVGLSALVAGSSGPGSALSALRQVKGFLPLTIIFGTVYEIRRSGGKRSMNWVVKLGIGVSFLLGLVNFGKEGMLIGFLAWGFAAMSEGYDFKPVPIISLAAGFVFFIYYLAPYSQYVRDQRSDSGRLVDDIPIALQYLGDLPNTRRLYLAEQEQVDISYGPHLYDKGEGFLDRLVQVSFDDFLVDFTERGHVFGLLPTYIAYANVIPHFIWADKPTGASGNMYMRETGILPDSDTTTGISIGAAFDAFHQASWLGVLLLLPFDLIVIFMIVDSVAGRVSDSPFAVLVMMMTFQAGAAAGLDGPIGLATVGMEGILFIVFVVKVVAPRVISVIGARQQNSLRPLGVAGALVSNDAPGARP